MITHRTLVGGWELCAVPDMCGLLYHFPDVTPAQMALVPDVMLWELCGVIDPPSVTDLQVWRHRGSGWRDAEGALHRDYDLPAFMDAGGNIIWYTHGERHRGQDRPAVMYGDGTLMWWVDGKQHRDGDRPAVTAPDGQRWWFRHGERYTPDVELETR